MKKYLVFIVCLMVLVSFGACGGGKDKTRGC
jgi:hypothetical protein